MTTAKFNPQYLLLWLSNFIHSCMTDINPLSVGEVVQVKWNRRLISFRIHVPNEFCLLEDKNKVSSQITPTFPPANSFQRHQQAHVCQPTGGTSHTFVPLPHFIGHFSFLLLLFSTSCSFSEFLFSSLLPYYTFKRLCLTGIQHDAMLVKENKTTLQNLDQGS